MGFLVDFAFYMAVLGVERGGPIGLVAPWRFKTLDFQPEKSNMSPVPADFHENCSFQKSCPSFLTRYLSCFRPGCFKFAFSSFWVGTKKMRDEKLCRFMVVSPREVPSLTFSCPFEILILGQFWRHLQISCPGPPEKVYTNCFRQPYVDKMPAFWRRVWKGTVTQNHKTYLSHL